MGKLMCWLGFHDIKAPGGIFPGAILRHCKRCKVPIDRYGNAVKD